MDIQALYQLCFGAEKTLHDPMEIKIRLNELGTLRIESNQVVACDPYIDPEAQSFSQPVPNGEFPVTAAVAHILEAEDQRVAAAFLHFSSREPVRWEMAVVGEQKVEDLGEDEIFGYGVDSGCGCFMDAHTAKLLEQRLMDEQYSDSLTEQQSQTYQNTWDWLNVVIDERSGLNAVIFSSGYGDGFYASYFGFDAEDRLVCLATDFAVFD